MLQVTDQGRRGAGRRTPQIFLPLLLFCVAVDRLRLPPPLLDPRIAGVGQGSGEPPLAALPGFATGTFFAFSAIILNSPSPPQSRQQVHLFTS